MKNEKLLQLNLSGARLTVSERLVGNRVAPIPGIKGSDSGGGDLHLVALLFTPPFSSFHFFRRFLMKVTERSTFAKVLEHIQFVGFR